jgi:hypothetical protein
VRGGPVAIKRAPRRLRLTKFTRDKNARKNRQRIFPVMRISTYTDRTCIQLRSNFEEPSPPALLIQFRFDKSVSSQTHGVKITDLFVRSLKDVYNRSFTDYSHRQTCEIFTKKDRVDLIAKVDHSDATKVSFIRNPCALWTLGEQGTRNDFIHGDLTRSSRRTSVLADSSTCRTRPAEGVNDRSCGAPWGGKRAGK